MSRAVTRPPLPVTSTWPSSGATARPRRAGGSVSSATQTNSPVFASSAATLQFMSAAKMRPLTMVSEDWFVGPGSRVIHAPPSSATLPVVIRRRSA